MSAEPRDAHPRRVAITRGAEQSAELEAQLTSIGVELVCAPLLRFAAPADRAPLEAAATHISDYDWIVITSSEGARALSARRAPPWPETRTAAVGQRTANTIDELGGHVDLIPERQNAAGLVEALAPVVRGMRVLIPQSAIALDTVARGLAAAGARVDAVVAYRTEIDVEQAEALRRTLSTGGADVLVVSSPSAARAVLDGAARGALDGVAIVSMGPTTTAALDAFGRAPDHEAASPTPGGLFAACQTLFTERGTA